MINGQTLIRNKDKKKLISSEDILIILKAVYKIDLWSYIKMINQFTITISLKFNFKEHKLLI